MAGGAVEDNGTLANTSIACTRGWGVGSGFLDIGFGWRGAPFKIRIAGFVATGVGICVFVDCTTADAGFLDLGFGWRDGPFKLRVAGFGAKGIGIRVFVDLLAYTLYPKSYIIMSHV